MSESTSNWVIERISEMLSQRHWTIYRLAKESDIPYSSLNNLFVRNTMPTISTLIKICEGLNVSMSEFFKDDTPELSESSDLTSDEKEILKKYRTLSKADKSLLNAYLSGLARL